MTKRPNKNKKQKSNKHFSTIVSVFIVTKLSKEKIEKII